MRKKRKVQFHSGAQIPVFVLDFVVGLSVTSSTTAFSVLSVNRICKQFCSVRALLVKSLLR